MVWQSSYLKIQLETIRQYLNTFHCGKIYTLDGIISLSAVHSQERKTSSHALLSFWQSLRFAEYLTNLTNDDWAAVYSASKGQNCWQFGAKSINSACMQMCLCFLTQYSKFRHLYYCCTWLLAMAVIGSDLLQ